MSTGLPEAWPRLLGDVGGSNARFALETAPGVIEDILTLSNERYPTLEDALRDYLAQVGARRVAHAAIGIANPLNGDLVRMTNCHWSFSIEAARRALGLSTLLLLNDFTALALALPRLPRRELAQVGGGAPRPDAPLALIGPGTGLGVSALVPHAGGWRALAGEGGHTSFAPANEREIGIWRYASARFGHVSHERLLSGSGLSLLHRALCALDGAEEAGLPPAEVSARGLSGADARCREALEIFCALLGSAAGNLALTLGARGGVYIGGGIVPRLSGFFEQSPFRRRFEDKGRMSAYLADIPVYLITSAYPALPGVAAHLADHLAPRSDPAPVAAPTHPRGGTAGDMHA
ncbi:glucokinase [Chromobacterium violaceum]|uniref:glucokinase n=1 Tax=Chromobacterium violaceum TaxID=536 RepID=UPI0009D9618A|nr:glucokinase [Chromobacterium violaceum]OQS46482.1 glucokinase [Chromobacterium violaceum]OQS49020.1 glucokinase [Chromobacterium violaceum]QRO31801.1 glucokinase [Chromobacterium violaceum]QRQ18399.1 glucokinase [Chromobacterium violaceum]